MSCLSFRGRWLAGGLLLTACSLSITGCADFQPDRNTLPLPIIRVMDLPPSEPAATSLKPTAFQPELPAPTPTPELAPAPKSEPKLAPAPKLEPELAPVPMLKPAPTSSPPLVLKSPQPSETRLVPINLDSVLRLAEQQNVQIALAREKLHETEAQQAVAAKAWMPQVYAGVGYYRQEGGIQAPDGRLLNVSSQALYPNLNVSTEVDLQEATYQRVNAEREAWQQRGELSKVTSDTLLEAGTTYLDLLTARRGEAVVHELERYMLEVQQRAEKMVTPEDRSAQVLVELARAEVSGRRQAIAHLHQQGDAAAAKLAYLLGMGACVDLVPVEEALTPIDLVDPNPPTCVLVARSLENGPGVRELQNVLAVMQNGFDRLNGPLRYLPTLQIGSNEGYLGAGRDSQMNFANSFDVGVSVRWNLTEAFTAREKRHVAESRIEQARLNLEDVRGKLTSGVEEARGTSLTCRRQIVFSTEQIKYAAKSYNLLQAQMGPAASINDMVQSVRGLESAHFNYLSAVNEYNKAQIRLLVLLGPAATQCQQAHDSSDIVETRPRR